LIGLVVVVAIIVRWRHVEPPGAAVALTGTWVPDHVPARAEYVRLGARWERAALRITFGPDGTWTAYDGCNRLGGDYEVHGDQLQAGGSSAGVGCPGQELDYEYLLAVSRTVGTTDGGLLFRDEDGEEVMRLSPAEVADCRVAQLAARPGDAGLLAAHRPSSRYQGVTVTNRSSDTCLLTHVGAVAHVGPRSLLRASPSDRDAVLRPGREVSVLVARTDDGKGACRTRNGQVRSVDLTVDGRAVASVPASGLLIGCRASLEVAVLEDGSA
jgi:hypothetical protein